MYAYLIWLSSHFQIIRWHLTEGMINVYETADIADNSKEN